MDIFNFQNCSKIKTSTKFVHKLHELNKVILQIVYPYKRILEKRLHKSYLASISMGNRMDEWIKDENLPPGWMNGLKMKIIIMTIRDHMGPYRIIRDHTRPYNNMGPYGILRNYFGPYRSLRDYTGPYGAIRGYTGPFGAFRGIWTIWTTQDQTGINRNKWDHKGP